MDMDETSQTINAVETTCRILDALRQQGKMGVTELSQELDLGKSTTHRHLATLRSQNFVVKDDNKYKLSHLYFAMTEQVKRQLRVYDEIAATVDNLAADTGEVSQFALEEQNRLVYIYKSAGENAIPVVSDAGYEGIFHCSGMGKAILAQLPDDEVERVIDEHGLAKETENTITEKSALYEELDRVRERGYAIDNEEFMPGLKCVAVPVHIEKPAVIGGISISAPASRMKQERIETELVPKAIDAANLVEVNARVGE